jgi:hypothetical protein
LAIDGFGGGQRRKAVRNKRDQLSEPAIQKQMDPDARPDRHNVRMYGWLLGNDVIAP